MSRWSILYRGPLSSCNYGCTYCPFAKTVNSAAELREDARQLKRFVDWVAARPEKIGVLFTPWGEALYHRAYQEAIIRLSQMQNVWKVAIQTNLSADLRWLSRAHAPKVGLWTTYHPSQTRQEAFLEQCQKLDQMGIPHSVGVVGFKDQLGEIRAIRKELPRETYLWINAFKREANYYSEADLRDFEEVDPLFRINAQYHPSRGRECRAGTSAFSVDGDGTMRRCHFIKEPIGNIYAEGFEQSLEPKPCSNATCGCHIGYIHLEPLDLYQVFGDGLLERIPSPRFRNPV